MKYALIFEFLDDYSVKLMCRVLGVSRSGYYDWLGRSMCAQEQRRLEVEDKVSETYEEFEAIYGARRITKELNDIGIPCSTN